MNNIFSNYNKITKMTILTTFRLTIQFPFELEISIKKIFHMILLDSCMNNL